MQCTIHITDATCQMLRQDVSDEVFSVKQGRIDQEAIASALENMHNPYIYMCGPPGMTENISQECLNLGVAFERIKYEKWW